MPSTNSRSAVVVALAEEFLDRYRHGERPSLKEYIDRHPELEADIREAFPAMAMMENIAIAEESIDDYPSRDREGAAPLQLGDYRIIREVGRGGMGVVYEAEQVSLGRHVALKVLPRKSFHDVNQRRRFDREAKAAAKLHHTNIVPVFGVGEHEGTPYYVMQFIQGLGLDAVLAEVRRLRGGGATELPARPSGSAAAIAQSLVTGTFNPATATASQADEPLVGLAADTSRSANGLPVASSVTLPGAMSGRPKSYFLSVAQIGRQVADALEYAHRQGVLHRDIKPSNLLLDMAGTVWVADFGLAKTDEPDNLTHTGDILGTLRYMPPEAFAGQADARSDVYALGLTLYELLTLRPAFAERDKNKLIKLIAEAEPEQLSHAAPSVPRDLQTIVQKAIEKGPAHRYATAGELADDLRRFAADEPIKARRIGAAERAWRWSRRNPAVAGLTAVLAFVLLGVTVASLLAATQFERTAANERAARQQADNARLARELNLADTYTSFGLAAGARDDPRQAVLWFAHAARLAADDQERADANRTRAAAWGRQAIQPVRAFVHPAEWIENNMAFHPGGRHLLTHGFDPATWETDGRLWDLEREEALPFPGDPGAVSAAGWDAAGERLAVGTPQGEVTISRFPGGEQLQRVPFAGRIARVLFSPDGRYCAMAADKRVRVWDCRQAAFATPELEHPAPVPTLAFHPQGELIATSCNDHFCRVFPVPAEMATPLFAPVPHLCMASRNTGHTPILPLFLDDGLGLLTQNSGEVSWRDPRTGQVLRVLRLGEGGAGNIMEAMALSGDGQHLALARRSSGSPHVAIYDVASAQPVTPKLEYRSLERIMSVAFSPDGRTLLVGTGHRTARLWSVPWGKPVSGPLTHPTSVTCVAFAPDGRHLATAQRGGMIRLWALPAGNPRDYSVAAGAQSFVRLSGDGRFLLPAGLSFNSCALRTTQVFDLTTGQCAGPLLEANGLILDAAFSPDGRHVAAAVRAASPAERRDRRGESGQLLVWDWRAGRLRHEPFPLPSEPRKVDYSPDGRQLAAICAKGELVVFDPATGTALRQWPAHPPYVDHNSFINNGAVRFSPDSRSLLTFGTSADAARVWDAHTGQLRHELKHTGICYDVQFSPDGRLVATAGYDNQVCVWELATGERLTSLAQPEWTYTALFSPDGQHLLTACRDNMARLWDWRAGRLVCPPFQHEHEVHAVAFTPDGRYVLSGSADGVLKVWEWRTGKPVCQPLPVGGAALSLAVTPDGKRVAVGGFMKELPVFHLDDRLTPSLLEPDHLCLWGEIVSGQRIEDGGGVTNLTANEWLQRWQTFRRSESEQSDRAAVKLRK